MCGISRRNASPAPAPRFSAYTTAPVPHSAYLPSGSTYSAPQSQVPPTVYPPPISITTSPPESRRSSVASSYTPSPTGCPTGYVSSRGSGYYTGGEPAATPQLVYSSASSTRSSRRSSTSSSGTSLYSYKDSPRGSYFDLAVRPVTRESHRSWCSPVEQGEYAAWKEEVSGSLGICKDRRGAVSPVVAPGEGLRIGY